MNEQEMLYGLVQQRQAEGRWDAQGPDVLAQEIADDLQTALDQFQAIAGGVEGLMRRRSLCPLRRHGLPI